jgi:hypothetical protein
MNWLRRHKNSEWGIDADEFRFTVVYDACVLYPAPLHDLLMHLALSDLFRARWNNMIHDEWIRNVHANRRCSLQGERDPRMRRIGTQLFETLCVLKPLHPGSGIDDPTFVKEVARLLEYPTSAVLPIHDVGRCRKGIKPQAFVSSAACRAPMA